MAKEKKKPAPKKTKVTPAAARAMKEAKPGELVMVDQSSPTGKAETSGYDWVRADVDEGQVTFTYRVTGLDRDGCTSHDEDVSDWTDKNIQELGCDLLDIERKFADQVEVRW